MFARLDVNGHGFLEWREFSGVAFQDCMCECLGYIPLQALECQVGLAMRRAGVDTDSELSLHEFDTVTWWLKRLSTNRDAEVDFAFAVFEGHRRGNSSDPASEARGGLDYDGDIVGPPVGHRQRFAEDNGDAMRSTGLPPDGVSDLVETLQRLVTSDCTRTALAVVRHVGRTWREQIDRQRRSHRAQASNIFADLGAHADGFIDRSELRGPVFKRWLRECIVGRLSDPCDVEALTDFLLAKAGLHKDASLTFKEFERLGWRLQRLEADPDLEVELVFNHYGHTAYILHGD